MLSPEVQQQASAIGAADIVIGVPSYNNADTIGAALEAVRVGLQKYFGTARALLVNSDGGSTDETQALVGGVDWDGGRVLTRHESPPGERVTVPYHGVPGRSAAQWTILELARLVEARACALIPADCRSVAPEWVDRLLRPILGDDHDYVAPVYQRHRYAGTLTSGLIYPVTRALYGKRIRQPLAQQFGLSRRLVARLCAQAGSPEDLAGQGVELSALVAAVTAGFSLCEAWLGPCVVDARGRSTDLAATLAQAVGSVFALTERTADAWVGIGGSDPVPVVASPQGPGVEPVEPNVSRMIRAFRLGLKDLPPLWEPILAPDTLTDVLALGPLPDEGLAFPHELWARVVYDFALAYHLRVLYRPHLLRSLVPLYLGRTAVFVRETASGGAPETEGWVERACRAFEREKHYLVARWR